MQPRTIVYEEAGRQIALMDSISYIAAEDAGRVIVSGSHGGTAAARYALEQPLTGVIFNDAGVGKDRAGIIALDMLADAGVPACAVAHTSARIGEADDTWEHGVVSYVNHKAADLGVIAGMPARGAAHAFLRGA
jgi:hypothetical protein